jgi:hypothetical protein
LGQDLGLLSEALGTGRAQNGLTDDLNADPAVIAAVAADPLALFVAAELALLVRGQALGVPMRFGAGRVRYLSGLDDYFLLWGVGSDGNFAEFTLKHV